MWTQVFQGLIKVSFSVLGETPSPSYTASVQRTFPLAHNRSSSPWLLFYRMWHKTRQSRNKCRQIRHVTSLLFMTFAGHTSQSFNSWANRRYYRWHQAPFWSLYIIYSIDNIFEEFDQKLSSFRPLVSFVVVITCMVSEARRNTWVWCFRFLGCVHLGIWSFPLLFFTWFRQFPVYSYLKHRDELPSWVKRDKIFRVKPSRNKSSM